MAKEILFKGRTLEEVQKMGIDEFAKIIDSRPRRKLKRGFTEVEKKFLKKLATSSKEVKTHCRDIVIVPEMLGKVVRIHSGKTWARITIELDMLGRRLGEFGITRKPIRHSSPGIGATRSSAALSVR